MLGVILFFLFLFLTFLVFCMVGCRTKQDLDASDAEQEKFIAEYSKKHKK